VLRINNSLKISETTAPRKLIFCRNVPWFRLLKICLHGSQIQNICQTGSEKPQKLTKSLKKSSSPEGPFSCLFKATSCDLYFSDYASESA
jgi:hypothetical protein